MTEPFISPEAGQCKSLIERPRLSHWVWRPWYSRLWWLLTSIYWAGAGVSLFFDSLASFYGSRLGAYLNIAFYPPFALSILSFGWLIAWKDALDYVGQNPENQNSIGWEWRAFDFQAHDERSRRRRNDPSYPGSPGYVANKNLRQMFDR